MMLRASTIIVMFALISCISGDEKVKSARIMLTNANFEHETINSNILVLFYSPRCELSKKFLPIFTKLAGQFNSRNGLKLASIDCDENKDLCAEKGSPDGGLQIYLYKIEGDRVKFNGVKNTDGLAKFLVVHLGENILDNILEIPEILGAINELSDITFNDHVAVGQHFVKFYAPWCGHCQRLAPTWDELASALEYDSSVSVSKIDCTKFRPICQDLDVKGYPTLLWIVDGKKVEKYTGPRSLDDLKAYVEKTAGIQAIVIENKSINNGDAPMVGVAQLTGSNFNHAIEKGVTFVKFFAPWCGHCKRMASTWDDLATKFIGIHAIKIAKVDCTLSENKDLCSQEEVNGFPTIYLYKNGQKIAEYSGTRTLDDLYDFIQRRFAGHDEL